MKKPKIKITCLLLAIMLTSISFVSVNALSTYEDGDYSFAETSDESFVALYGLSRSATQDEVNVVVPDSSFGKYVMSVYEYAFFENETVKSVDFSNARHLNYIDSHAFSKSAVSGSVIFPSSLRTLGYAAFQECNNLTSVSGGNALKEIPGQCFYKCASLSEVSVPRNVEKIDKLAFANCPVLQKVIIPDSVTEIDNSAFSNSSNVVIYCYYDSFALTYAKQKRIAYHLLDEVLLGDVDGDGAINVSDVTTIQRYLAELEELEGIYLHAADANQDGTVDISDATALQMYIAEYDLPYPIGEVLTQ